ncbi:uncharacterized protein LOC131070435 isoform X3 [Cryptomeria japonica]|uniref:uncharacterized protein LOC131070435 isoform X3 n=1 Tax=Cryptomeria japonica TaxID=3369 RepID=UPI0025AD1AC8|nr:uncharacterized protein LOC131070435 isoform X3 [Cryptomeria japonica]
MTSIRLLLPLQITTCLCTACPSSSSSLSSSPPLSGLIPPLKNTPSLFLKGSSINTHKPYKGLCFMNSTPVGAPMQWKKPKGEEDGSTMSRSVGLDEEIPKETDTGGAGTAVLVPEYKPIPDLDYLQELLAIQQQGPRAIGFFGTRNMGYMHQQLIEILSYAMVITKNHIYTSGASGTNAAVIRGALRAEKPDLLTVILPQSLTKQSPESQELLSKVKNVFEKPYNDHLPLIEASRLCNMDIISHVQQVICFAFHDSRLLLETCQEAKNQHGIIVFCYIMMDTILKIMVVEISRASIFEVNKVSIRNSSRDMACFGLC